MEKQDVFDRLISHRLFRFFQPFYTKHKEPLLYLFFGGLTTLVSLASFAGAEHLLGLPPLVANVVSWILSVAFAYITNRIWVFSHKAEDAQGIFREAISFAGGRVLTLFLEEVILAVGIHTLHMNSFLVKMIAQVLVVVSNYFISKLFVFKARNQTGGDEIESKN